MIICKLQSLVDRKLVYRDKENILDRYTYLYDLLGNKTGITKERRGLERESGQYRYGYDALGRLSEIQKDGNVAAYEDNTRNICI